VGSNCRLTWSEPNRRPLTPEHLSRLEAWVDSIRGHVSPLEIAAALARSAAQDAGLRLDDSAPALLSVGAVGLPGDVVGVPEALGIAYERALDAGHRHQMGVHYTPARVASALAAIALGQDAHQTVCDPSVGGGAFLLAAADELERRGIAADVVVAERLWGLDIDPDVVLVADAALSLWGSRDGQWVGPDAHLQVADTLRVGRNGFAADTEGFDVVLGNPPFQNQLQASTARDAMEGRHLRDRWQAPAGPYADTAAFFLLAALELVADDGVVLLVQPESILGARDAAPIRQRVLASSTMEGLWSGGSGVFAADVRVCAPLLRRGAVNPVEIQRWVGSEVEAVAPLGARDLEATWSPLVADLLGAPLVDVTGFATLGELVSATAGFRDEFYGLAPHTSNTPEASSPKLVTVGMIDPLRNRWGTATFRYAGGKWTHPRVDTEALAADNAKLARWVEDRTVPKVMVATQTKVIEVVVDPVGDIVPCTPVIAVVGPPDRLWHIAAALMSPAVTAIALARAAGAALSQGTIKLSAKQVLALPTPTDAVLWDEGAALARAAADSVDPGEWSAALLELGTVMTEAYGLPADHEVVAWWADRLPPWR
jgi:hypothetical protein